LFDHDYTIRPEWNRRAGHDLNCFSIANFQSAGRSSARADLANDPQGPASIQIICPAGEAITRGAYKWRLVSIGF
jgi:hypothetical protein